MEELDLESLDANLENGGTQTDLPSANTALTCGIIALPFSFGIIGIILAIIAIANGHNSIKMYKRSPGKYTEKSFKRANAGRTCGIISLSLFVLVIIIVIGVIGLN